MTSYRLNCGMVGLLLALASCTGLETVGLRGDSPPAPSDMQDASTAVMLDAALADAELPDSAGDARMDEEPYGDAGAADAEREAEHEEGEEGEEDDEVER